MPEKRLFEYSVIRAVPKVERGEFINVGVVLYCASVKFLKASFHLDEKRLNDFSPSLDIPSLREYLHAYEQICAGGSAAGPIGKLPVPERFRWLTATRSTILQSSPVHTGLCDDPGEKLEQIFCELVK